jgi:4'-phosphopantetheinyl transferase
VTDPAGSADPVAPADRGPALAWARLDVGASELERLTACLSAQERDRGARFHRPLDGRRFLAARGWLRHVLADELGCSPADAAIAEGEGAKPRLIGSDLRFNASRSGGTALYATSWEMEVGVDIEAIVPVADLDAVAARFFSAAEQHALASLAPERRLTGFLECWTRKEAYVKGIGAGLTFPIATVEVWDGGALPAKVAGWSVHQLDVGPGFVAALAAAGDREWAPKAPLALPGINFPAHAVEIP